ncbi:hypothetical protein IGI04_001697 [Brassica rapa subsp. trilocularis]|uniref:NYN domain-containing protein n=1 Tax=Brassica rapa subsp. trilocularis TaxID=1813537 RepID=A0ABQ7NVL0_BRACM|nr:hypothetical protein IGI04_001697 [Brassica rapa subsp. trilocularis]
MASKPEMTVSKTSCAFFTERHGSDGFHYHKVYNDERDIPEADYHGKTQVADLEVVASLKELLQRMKDGVYTARRLVLISCDKRFRDIVDDLRAKEMVVYFIKPECNVLQVEHNQSIYPKESTTTGIYIVAKTGEEKVQEIKRVMNERIHLERQSQGNSMTLEKYCNEKCTVSARSFKRAGSSFQSQEAKVQERKMMGTTPTIIFKTKEIFRVSNKKGSTHSEQDHQWTMQQTDAWEWSLKDIGK